MDGNGLQQMRTQIISYEDVCAHQRRKVCEAVGDPQEGMGVGCFVMTAIHKVATNAHVQHVLGCGVRLHVALELCRLPRRLQHHGMKLIVIMLSCEGAARKCCS